MPNEDDKVPVLPYTVTRREFLQGLAVTASGGVVAGVVLGVGVSELLDDDSPQAAAPGQPGGGSSVERAVVTTYPRANVTSLSSLAVGNVVDFNYPTEEAPASLFRLGRPAAGGIGPGHWLLPR